MGLIEKNELRLGKNRFTDALLSGFMMRFLGIRRLNRLYESLSGHRGRELTRQFLAQRNIGYSVRPEPAEVIPRKGGGLIVVANHPFGALDGILLMDMLTGIRNDVKFMGNELLSRIKPMEDFFIEIDPFHPSGYKHLNGLRHCREHLHSGGVLVIFPAGEVSTYQQGFTRLEDREWNEATIKFIRNSLVPVLPLFIEGRNSRFFHIAGKTGPVLRTALLARELLNKKNTRYRIFAGSPLLPFRYNHLSVGEFGAFLRINTEMLRYIAAPAPESPAGRTESRICIPSDAIAAPSAEGNIGKLVEKYKLTAYGLRTVAGIPAAELPEKIRAALPIPPVENAVLIMVYEESSGAIPAWTPVLPGDAVGRNGFGFSESFRAGEALRDIFDHSLEVGEFYTDPSAGPVKTLYLLLWQGLVRFFATHEKYRYLTGVLRTEDTLKPVSRALLAGFIKKNHYNFEWAAHVISGAYRNEKITLPDLPRVENIGSLNGLDKVITDMEEGKQSIPANLKKYLGLKTEVIGIRQEPGDNGRMVTDYLILYDRNHLPRGYRSEQ